MSRTFHILYSQKYIVYIQVVLKEKNTQMCPMNKQYAEGFGLVPLFNGISTFMGYLMPKPFF